MKYLRKDQFPGFKCCRVGSALRVGDRDLVADVETFFELGQRAFFQDLGAEQLVASVPGVELCIWGEYQQK